MSTTQKKRTTASPRTHSRLCAFYIISQTDHSDCDWSSRTGRTRHMNDTRQGEDSQHSSRLESGTSEEQRCRWKTMLYSCALIGLTSRSSLPHVPPCQLRAPPWLLLFAPPWLLVPPHSWLPVPWRLPYLASLRSRYLPRWHVPMQFVVAQTCRLVTVRTQAR